MVVGHDGFADKLSFRCVLTNDRSRKIACFVGPSNLRNSAMP